MPHVSFYENHLLQSMSRQDLHILRPLLQPIDLKRGEVLYQPGQPFEHVYFPSLAVLSVVSTTPVGAQLEIGIIGREGMAGSALVLGVDRAPHKVFVQIADGGFRIAAEAFKAALKATPTLEALLLKYVHVFHVQVGSTAVANGAYKVEQRLARWLLMCEDRIASKHLPLVHEFLSVMLGVRRASVTQALHQIESLHAIRNERGLIVILDREKLIEISDGSYGEAEAEYDRLIGRPTPVIEV